MISAPELFEHGIRTEQSDLRAHVCVLGRKVYVFKTREAVEIMEDGLRKKKYRITSACQAGVNGRTSEGILVPVNDLPESIMRFLSLKSWSIFDGWTERMTTSEKGERAIQVVLHCIKRGYFPFWIDAQEDKRTNIQVKRSTDIVLFLTRRIQVKCDYRGGNGPGCTGNLYFEIAECNPMKYH